MKHKVGVLISKFTWLDWILVGAFIFSLGYLVFFGWTRLRQRIVPVEHLADASINGSQSSIWVDVAGAVAHPGVYQLSGDARYKDAIVAAGGVTDSADRVYMSRVVNMAARVKDGEKIYVPLRTDTQTAEVKGETSSLININSASESVLDSLPGIGPVRAGEIIKNRPYKKIEELLSKGVVPKSVYDEISGRLTVY